MDEEGVPDGQWAYKYEASLRGKGGIFTLHHYDKLHCGHKVTGLFHHSSMTRGHCVKFAGALSIVEGRLTMLSPHSGHYIPSQAEYSALQSMLQAKGVDLSFTDIKDMVKSK